MNCFPYKLIPPRPTFAADMTGTEQAVMAEHAAYWTRQRDLGVAAGFARSPTRPAAGAPRSWKPNPSSGPSNWARTTQRCGPG